MAAPVVRVAAPLDELALLELVEKADELAAVVTEDVRDRALRLARALVENRENRVVVRREAGLLVGRHGPFLRREAEALQQKRARFEQLVGKPPAASRAEMRGSSAVTTEV